MAAELLGFQFSPNQYDGKTNGRERLLHPDHRIQGAFVGSLSIAVNVCVFLCECIEICIDLICMANVQAKLESQVQNANQLTPLHTSFASLLKLFG